MNNLFIDPITFEEEKTASVYLDKDQTTWVKRVVGRFLETYPVLQNQGITLVWTKKEPDKGYAVGTLKVLGGSVPVIIHDFHLYPLDVIMFGDTAMPLNQNSLQEILSNPSPFKGITKSPAKSSLELFSPSLQMSPTDTAHTMPGNASEIRPAKYASLIDQIEHVDSKDVKRLLKNINGDDAIKLSFASNGNWDVVEKLANKKATSAETEIESFIRNLDVDRQYTYSDTFGNRIVKQANSAVGHTWETVVSESEAEGLKDKIAENSLEQNFADNIKIATRSLESQIQHGNIKEARMFSIMDSSNSLFIDKKANYKVIDSSIDTTEQKFSTSVEGADPMVGDVGTFVIDSKATNPFEIISMQKTAAVGEWKIMTFDGFKKVAYYPIKTKSSTFIKHDTEKSAYYIPGNAQFLKLEGTAQMQEPAVKVATHSLTKDSAGLYNFKGIEFTKYAATHPIRDLSLDEAIWTAIHCNADRREVSKIATILNNETVDFYSNITSPRSVQELAATVEGHYLEKSAEIGILTDLIKEAAVISDKGTVDAVLSLGLMNKDNILEFVALLPQYSTVLGELSKLLVVSRLGLSQIPEAAVSRATQSLANIIFLLQQLQTVHKRSK